MCWYLSWTSSHPHLTLFFVTMRDYLFPTVFFLLHYRDCNFPIVIVCYIVAQGKKEDPMYKFIFSSICSLIFKWTINKTPPPNVFFFFWQCDFLFLVMSFLWLSSLSCFVFFSLFLTTRGLMQIANAFPLLPIIVAFYIGKLNNNKKCWSFSLYFSLCDQVHIPLPTLMVDVLFFIIKIIFFHLMFFIVYCVPHVVCCPCSLSTLLWCKKEEEEKHVNCPWSKLWQTPNMILCLILSKNLHFYVYFFSFVSSPINHVTSTSIPNIFQIDNEM